MPVFLTQDLVKSMTASRISWGTQAAVREPQVLFLNKHAPPSVLRALRSWFATWLQVARCVSVPSCSEWYALFRKRRLRSRKTPFANDRILSELADLSVQFNPILRGWQNYYTRFYGSAMSPVWQHVNYYLVHWMKAPPPWFDLACIEILVNRAINSSGVNVKSPARELDYWKNQPQNRCRSQPLSILRISCPY